MKISATLLCSLLLIQFSQAAPFELRESSPDSPAFKARFMASYGVNGTIEPNLTTADQTILRDIMPLLESNPRGAISIIKSRTNSDSSAAFDFLLGNLYYQLEDYSASEQAIQTALRKMPDYRRAWRTLGLIYTRNNQPEQAIEAWRKVIALGGGDAQSYGLLGYFLLGQQHYASAQTAYEAARMFAPESEDFKRGLAHCLLANNETDLAISLFDELIENRPDDQDYWLMQANAFLAQNRYHDAIANLTTATKLGNSRASTWLLLGNLYLNESMLPHATDSYLNVLDSTDFTNLDNTTISTLIQPLNHLTARHSLTYARTYYQALKDKLPAPIPHSMNLSLKLTQGKLLTLEGNYDAAIELLKPITDEQPLNGEALMTLAQAYASNDQLEVATFYFERAALLDEYKANALLELARLSVAQSDFHKALAHLDDAYQHSPSKHLDDYREQVRKAYKNTQ